MARQIITPKAFVFKGFRLFLYKKLLIKKSGCFEYHAVIADKIEYGCIHRAFIRPTSGMDRRGAPGSLRGAFTYRSGFLKTAVI